MSENYLWGEYQTEDIHCNISIASEETKEIFFFIHELSFFSDSSDMCLNIQGSELTQNLCAGSQIYDKGYGPYNMKQGLQFSIKKVDITDTDHNFRFWIDLKGMFICFISLIICDLSRANFCIE